MIEVTKLNNTQIVINSELIECVEENPDTTITLLNGKKYLVRETVSEIVEKAVEFKRRCKI